MISQLQKPMLISFIGMEEKLNGFIEQHSCLLTEDYDIGSAALQ